MKKKITVTRLVVALAITAMTVAGCGGKSEQEKFDDKVKELSHGLGCNTDVLMTGTMSVGCP